MKELILSNWTLWRVIRMIFSIVFITEGIIKSDFIMIAAGAFLFIHALLNVCSSCAGGSCEIPKK